MGTVFQDEFQSGTILTTDNPPGAWTSKTAYTDVVSSPFRRGPYAAEASGGSNHYWEKVLGSSYSELYFAGYVQFPVLPGNNNTASFLKILSNSGTYWVAGGLNTDASGNMKWALFINGYLFVANSYYTANTDQWYFIEIEYKQGTGTGVAKMWVDSNLWLEITGLSLVEAAQRVQGGNVYTISQPFVSYGDNYVASTTHISANGNSELHNLSVDNTLTMKTYEGNWLTIETTTGNILQISQAVNVLDDISAYGFLGTATDPNKSTGGGAILMGHAFTASSDMPCISLTDLNYQTLWIKKYDGNPDHTLLTQLPWGDMELENLTAHGSINMGSTIGMSVNGEKLKLSLPHAFTLEMGVDAYGIGFITNSYYFYFNKLTGFGGDIRPWATNTYSCGLSSAYWQKVYAGTYYGKNTSIQYFDALDDLTLLKNHKVKKVTKDGVEIEVVDVDSLPHLKPDEEDASEFYDTGKMHGYLIGCIKALLSRLEKLEEAGKQNA